jgi:hypothetical protein
MTYTSFAVSRADHLLIAQIAERALPLYQIVGDEKPAMHALMDLTACHANGCRLRLTDLLAADEVNFAHDIFGIRRHLDRTTGKLLDCFVPRFALPVTG